MKRVTWFVGGAVAGALGADAAKRKVREAASAAAAKLSPVQVARSVGDRAKRIVRTGTETAVLRQRELRARRAGRATTLEDELGGDEQIDLVIVDGKPVEPGKVVILRQPDALGEGTATRLGSRFRRRGA